VLKSKRDAGSLDYPETMSDEASTPDEPWSVSALTTKLKAYLDRLGLVWVEGEITQWDVRASGIFGKLKDLNEDSTMGFTIWSNATTKMPDDLKQGDRVVALVKVDFWKKNGNLGLNILELRRMGLGDLLEKLERLRAQLAKEGLFGADRKVALPFLPGCIGLITGENSDAEKDVLRNAHLRWPAVQFRTINTKVQGDGTVEQVIAAIKKLDADPEVDVIIIARGGGDFQNLLPFSDEALVRAAAACVTPLVSAIGHEADAPLLDNVADLRASTPTDAAKRVVPDVGEELAKVLDARGRIANRVLSFVTGEFDRLETLRSRPVLADGEWIITSRAEEIVRTVQRGSDLVDRALHLATTETATLKAQLRALSPQQTLDRGYAIAVATDGTVVRSSADAPTKTAFTLTLADGKIGAVSTGASTGASTPAPSTPAK
jgi:exodeoxyribonuclease VII large subunit